MADIFISYASADRDRARVLAQALTEQGFSVWWDRTIPPGRQFDEVIEEALDAARCVVVLWSNASVASTWVKTEAAEAMRRKILVPVLIDDVKIPLEFRRLQAADLSLWKGESAHEELQKFFQSIEVNVGHGGASRAAPAPPPVELAPQQAEARPQPQPLAQPQPQPQPQPPSSPPVARPPAPAPRSKTKVIGIGVAAFAAVVVIAVGYTAYNERVKRVAMEERAERERRAAEEARRAAEEAAARAKVAQEEAAKEAARRKAEDQRRAAEDARRAAESAARARAAQEEAARARATQEAASRARVAQEEAARARTAQEEAARAARERAEQERKQKTAARTTTMRVSFYDHALRYSGVLTGSGWTGTLRATVWDLRSGAQIGNYEVPMTVTRQGTSDLVVSGSFSIPRDSVTPYPHVHTPRLILRTQSDGTLRFIENCPRAGECYPAK